MSLRARLVALVLGLTVALLGGLWLYVGSALPAWSRESLDATLAARATAVVRDAELEHGSLELDEELAEDRSFPLRIEAADGAVLLATPGLSWPELPAPGRERRFDTVVDGAGRLLRVHSRSFVPEHGSRTAPLVLRVAAPEGAFAAVGERFRTGLAVALLLSLFLGGAGAALLASVSLRPLRALAAELSTIEAASLDRRVHSEGLPSELRPLARAWNGVLARLQEAFGRQASFVARASHALRTPAATVLTEAEVALRRERTPEEYRQALLVIAGAARAQAALIDRLLSLSRVEEVGTRLSTAEVVIEELFAELAGLFAARAAEAGISVVVSAPPGLTVRCDRAVLREGLEALVDNALRYTPAGGTVTIEAASAGELVELSVRDTGPGLSADDRAHAGERFFRGSAAARSGAPGSGLGLALAGAAAAAHGGTLALDPAPGGGLRARLRLPASPGAGAA